LTENDGHEIGGQDIYRLKIDYITMKCAIEKHIHVLKRNYIKYQRK